jgi:MFS transporter, PAT family, beta-lactamase induction signal transducer AmpG
MSDRKGVLAALETYLQPRMATMLMLGFSSGLPFLLIFATLSTWLRQAGVSRTDIGLMFYAGFAYTLKFLWAPLIDQLRFPLLYRHLGRRRSWLIAAQCAVAGALVAMSFADPARGLAGIALTAVVLAFAGATQDICIDAWRIEAAPKQEQGAMAAAYQLGYRFALLASGAGALYLAQYVSWRAAYLAMAALMLVGIGATLGASRTPETPAPAEGEKEFAAASQRLGFSGGAARAVVWLYRAVVAPFVDFFARHSWTGLLILALVGTYRLPDFVMGVMANPLYIDLGHSLATIATVVKLFGVWMTIAGALVGGVVVARLGVSRTLFLGIAASILANLVFAWLATRTGDVGALTAAISTENFASGFAGTVLIAYMSSLTSTTFTATQYALFSSFYALPGKLLGGISGIVVDWFSTHASSYAQLFGGLAGVSAKTIGYVPFFVCTALLGIPALLLIVAVYVREGEVAPGERPVPGRAR